MSAIARDAVVIVSVVVERRQEASATRVVGELGLRCSLAEEGEVLLAQVGRARVLVQQSVHLSHALGSDILLEGQQLLDEALVRIGNVAPEAQVLQGLDESHV